MKGVFIIAEAGVNHNGSIRLARDLVDAAKECGADAIKFQTFSSEDLVTSYAEKAKYQKESVPGGGSQLEMLKRLELDKAGHQALFLYCRKRKIEFISSPFGKSDANFLDGLGVRIFKIPSGEITNHPFLRHVALKGKPVIMSTGMSTMAETRRAVDIILSTGNRRLTLLHCVTEYPAPYREINLKAMVSMREELNLPVGYSDHTSGTEIPAAAVAMGAEIIEKHLTLDKSMEGPDHKASADPAEFAMMVRYIRNISAAMGDGIKRPAKCEKKNIFVARKSIVAATGIRKGEKLTEDNLLIKRPGTGISPEKWNSILGRKAIKNFSKDEQIVI